MLTPGFIEEFESTVTVKYWLIGHPAWPDGLPIWPSTEKRVLEVYRLFVVAFPDSPAATRNPRANPRIMWKYVMELQPWTAVQ